MLSRILGSKTTLKPSECPFLQAELILSIHVKQIKESLWSVGDGDFENVSVSSHLIVDEEE